MTDLPNKISRSDRLKLQLLEAEFLLAKEQLMRARTYCEAKLETFNKFGTRIQKKYSLSPRDPYDRQTGEIKRHG